MIRVYIGKPRQGKDYGMAADVLSVAKRDTRHIVSNYYLDGAWRMDSLIDMMVPGYGECLWAISELGTVMDSRLTMKQDALLIQAIELHGKFGQDIYGTAQHPMQWDTQARRLVDEWVMCHRIGPDGRRALKGETGLWTHPWAFRYDAYIDSDFGEGFTLKVKAVPLHHWYHLFSARAAARFDTKARIMLDGDQRRIDERALTALDRQIMWSRAENTSLMKVPVGRE